MVTKSSPRGAAEAPAAALKNACQWAGAYPLTPQVCHRDRNRALLRDQFCRAASYGGRLNSEYLGCEGTTRTTSVRARTSHGARRAALNKSSGAEAPMTKMIPRAQHTTTVGTIKTRQHTERKNTRNGPAEAPSDCRTSRRPVSRKLGVELRCHSTTLHSNQPIPRVTTINPTVRARAWRRMAIVAGGAAIVSVWLGPVAGGCNA
jgi:hypothetical protein